jgi:hypothetical protein
MAKASPSPLSASLLGVPKGAAAPASDVPPLDRAGEADAVPERVAAPVVRRSAPVVTLPPAEEPKTALTVRLPISTQERLREAAHRTRREKQSIVDDALLAWLETSGF